MTLFSFEVFPPKAANDLARLGELAQELAVLSPDFISVTYGAGGGDRDKSFEALGHVTSAGVGVAAHLTCVGQSRSDVDAVIRRYRELGIDHVVALRGDPPTGIDAPYEAHADGYRSTAELVAAAREMGIEQVSVSAYPEVHPQSPSFEHDLAILADKVNAGARRAIAQMCFDTEAIVTYIDRVADAGIEVEVVPGIFPIHSFPAVSRFAGRCGATVPADVAERFAGVEDDLEATHAIGAEFAAEQIATLVARGVERFHVYTVNRSVLAADVLGRLAVPTS